ncbi:hypothetical protein DFS34DRAFT_351995 [Phlyctochytrium arcticum]|nr:hypothetical protein DFS34DRAFT_351995 [Phlyctochytrium arcticum]
MPCILKVRIVAARNLPVMDRSTELTDAFVEVKFADYEAYRTQIARRTLNPVWNEDFRFEVTYDADLQNEPLELKVMDYDQITYNDSIGTVMVDLNPLLTWDSMAQISGWIPIFDTLRGVRGELNVQVRLQFFGDVNPFKDSSAGVQFYSTTAVPPTVTIVSILGFVSALDNDDDPEYHWSDNFRTPRTSNESRTRVMFRLSGQLRRQLGRKALELNANAVIGFKQYFDIESEERAITARAMGTAVRLAVPDQVTIDRGLSWSSLQTTTTSPMLTPFQEHPVGSPATAGLIMGKTVRGVVGMANTPMGESGVGAGGTIVGSIGYDGVVGGDGYSDKSSLKDEPVVPPSSAALLAASAGGGYKSLECMILTLHHFPAGSILGIGGLVSATSVKVIENDSIEVREAWWTELREEIKSHARALGCHYVIGYSENSSISDELAVLHCSGTAATVDLSVVQSSTSGGTRAHSSRMNSVSVAMRNEPAKEEEEDEQEKSTGGGAIASTSNTASAGPAQSGTPPIGPPPAVTAPSAPAAPMHRPSLSGSEFRDSFLDACSRRKTRRSHQRTRGCQACHITYTRDESPFPMSYAKCALCRRKHVPEVLLSTIEPPPDLETVGNGVLLEAHVCRHRKPHGDARPVVVSEAIPFAQYDIHRQLMYKLRINGLNAVFGVKIQFSVGESLMTAVATGTAVYVRALPTPPALKVFRNLDVVDEEDKNLMEIQKKIMARSETNRKNIELALEALECRAEAGNPEGKNSESNGVNNESGGDAANQGLNAPSETDSISSSESESGPEDLDTSRRTHRSVVIQIDDEQDEDLVLMHDLSFPDHFQICNIGLGPKSDSLLQPSLAGLPPSPLFLEQLQQDTTGFPFPTESQLPITQLVSIVRHATITAVSHHPSRQLANVFKQLYAEAYFHLSTYLRPCVLAGVKYDVQIVKENEVQIVCHGVVMGRYAQDELDVTVAGDEEGETGPSRESLTKWEQSQGAATNTFPNASGRTSAVSLTDEMVFSLEDEEDAANAQNNGGNGTPPHAANAPGSINITATDLPPATPTIAPTAVDITPLWYIPPYPATRFLGRVSLHFVKESAQTFDPSSGLTGMGGFTHAFLVELLGVLRAHAVALGGNAVVGFAVEKMVVEESLKNGAYALVSIGGDVVWVDRPAGMEGGGAGMDMIRGVLGR